MLKQLKTTTEEQLGIAGSQASLQVSMGHVVVPSKSVNMKLKKQSKKIINQMNKNINSYQKLKDQVNLIRIKNEIGTNSHSKERTEQQRIC